MKSKSKKPSVGLSHSGGSQQRFLYRLASRLGMTGERDRARAVFNSVVDVLLDHLAEGHTIVLPRFGRLVPHLQLPSEDKSGNHRKTDKGLGSGCVRVRFVQYPKSRTAIFERCTQRVVLETDLRDI